MRLFKLHSSSALLVASTGEEARHAQAFQAITIHSCVPTLPIQTNNTDILPKEVALPIRVHMSLPTRAFAVPNFSIDKASEHAEEHQRLLAAIQEESLNDHHLTVLNVTQYVQDFPATHAMPQLLLTDPAALPPLDTYHLPGDGNDIYEEDKPYASAFTDRHRAALLQLPLKAVPGPPLPSPSTSYKPVTPDESISDSILANFVNLLHVGRAAPAPVVAPVPEIEEAIFVPSDLPFPTITFAMTAAAAAEQPKSYRSTNTWTWAWDMPLVSCSDRASMLQKGFTQSILAKQALLDPKKTINTAPSATSRQPNGFKIELGKRKRHVEAQEAMAVETETPVSIVPALLEGIFEDADHYSSASRVHGGIPTLAQAALSCGDGAGAGKVKLELMQLDVPILLDDDAVVHLEPCEQPDAAAASTARWASAINPPTITIAATIAALHRATRMMTFHSTTTCPAFLPIPALPALAPVNTAQVTQADGITCSSGYMWPKGSSDWGLPQLKPLPVTMEHNLRLPAVQLTAASIHLSDPPLERVLAHEMMGDDFHKLSAYFGSYVKEALKPLDVIVLKAKPDVVLPSAPTPDATPVHHPLVLEHESLVIKPTATATQMQTVGMVPTPMAAPVQLPVIREPQAEMAHLVVIVDVDRFANKQWLVVEVRQLLTIIASQLNRHLISNMSTHDGVVKLLQQLAGCELGAVPGIITSTVFHPEVSAGVGEKRGIRASNALGVVDEKAVAAACALIHLVSHFYDREPSNADVVFLRSLATNEEAFRLFQPVLQNIHAIAAAFECTVEQAMGAAYGSPDRKRPTPYSTRNESPEYEEVEPVDCIPSSTRTYVQDVDYVDVVSPPKQLPSSFPSPTRPITSSAAELDDTVEIVEPRDTTGLIMIGERCMQNIALLRQLESVSGAQFVERGLSEPYDLMVDASTAVCIVRIGRTSGMWRHLITKDDAMAFARMISTHCYLYPRIHVAMRTDLDAPELDAVYDIFIKCLCVLPSHVIFHHLDTEDGVSNLISGIFQRSPLWKSSAAETQHVITVLQDHEETMVESHLVKKNLANPYASFILARAYPTGLRAFIRMPIEESMPLNTLLTIPPNTTNMLHKLFTTVHEPSTRPQ